MCKEIYSSYCSNTSQSNLNDDSQIIENIYRRGWKSRKKEQKNETNNINNINNIISSVIHGKEDGIPNNINNIISSFIYGE